MPSPHPTNPRRPGGPTVKQLRLLRALATRTGHTFAYPTTKAQASAEIRRLCAAIDATGLERLIDRDRPGRDGEPPRDATAIRDDEIAGYGARAHWTHHRHGDRS